MAKLEDRDLAWMDTAPIRIELVRTVDATPEQVFAVLADFERWPKWATAMKSVRATGGTGVGSTRQVVLGPMKVDERFLAWEPGRRFAFLVSKAGLPGLTAMLEDFRLEPAPGGGTLLTYVGAIEPAKAVRFLSPAIRGTFLRQLVKVIDGLVRYAGDDSNLRGLA